MSQPPVAEPVPVATGLPSRVVVDSAGLGWSGARVREVVDPPIAEFVLPPVDSLTVVLITAGSYVVESGPGPRRRHALVSPGTSAVNAAQREVRARWRSDSRSPFRSVHLTIAASVLAETRDALPRHARRPDPDYLRRADPFVREAVLELGRATRLGLPALHAEALAQSVASYLLLDENRDRGAVRGGLGARALGTVVDLMHERIAEPITLAELAAAAHLSHHHFLRQFSASTRTTPMRYLTSLRMQRAQELLRDDTLTVQAVAARCGYPNPAHFTSVFRRVHGVTPSTFRGVNV
ncbi:helix-turn-helix domain-containing protein [Umezawaea beigongshangensis]|uniref:helix-turn-helix domain-containing protein n=1 Tax=Umezawaea beigongshangensis TaxID=2780383 RepID=UPI0018F263A8|nr:helix-turn-helix transcriptional regulator [Umezawaea beigongshangensis]